MNNMNIIEVINEKLNEIEEKEKVRIIHCVESGSRAWGFFSPDSDYDVRFVYIRNKNWYLNLNEQRDVIEWQLDDTLDINGWDIRKTLILLHNSNPTIYEWDKSPIVYRTGKEWEIIRELLPKYYSAKTMFNHYLGTAKGNYRNYLKGDEVRLKKYFYVLRPILACNWVLDQNTPPPVRFDELKKDYLPEYLISDVDRLLELKMDTPELGYGKRIDSLNDDLDRAIDRLSERSSKLDNKEYKQWDELNETFLELLEN